VDLVKEKTNHGDTFVLASDGLWSNWTHLEYPGRFNSTTILKNHWNNWWQWYWKAGAPG